MKKHRRRCICWCGLLLTADPRWPENPNLRNDHRFKCRECNSTFVYDDEGLAAHNLLLRDPVAKARWHTSFRKLRLKENALTLLQNAEEMR